MVLKATKESLLSQQLTVLMSLTLPFFVLAVLTVKVLVGRPDVKGREAILRVHAKNKPLAQDVDLNWLLNRHQDLSVLISKMF